MRTVRAIALVLMTAVGGAAGAERICPRAASGVVLDGKLDDAAWAKALVLADFTRPASDERPGKAIEARLCFDDQALYLAFACDEPNPERIRAKATVENEDVWQDDCVEVWIRTTDSSLEFDQFIANTLGTRQSLRRRQSREAAPWKPQWQVKVARAEKRWVAELRIPFADLGLAAPAPGDMLQVKLGREDYTGREAALSAWPPGSPYAGTEGFAPVYLERANLLPNPDLSEREGDKPLAWRFGKGDEGLFATATDGARRVIAFQAPGRYTTMQQSLKLKPNARYRLEANVKGAAGVYLRARTSPKPGAESVPYTADTKPSPDYRHYEVHFPTGPTGEALILVGNTESHGAGEVRIADLRVVREPAVDAFGSPIPVEAGAEPTVVTKLLVADCRALKGFIGSPVDGSTKSWNWNGETWEYNQRGAGGGVGYAYRGNDGLHVTLADKGGFDALLIEGGARVKLYRDCARYDDPASGALVAEFPGSTHRTRAWFDKPVATDRVSFFDLEDGLLADVSFFRVRRGLGGLVPGPRGKASIEVQKAGLHRITTQPLDGETPLAAVGLDFVVAEGPTPIPFTAVVPDPLNPRRRLFEADLLLSKPGRCRVVLDFPDQVVPKGTALAVDLTVAAAAQVKGLALDLFPNAREQALPEALAYRKFLLRTCFCSISEARPWTGWYDEARMQKSLADKRWGPQLRELLLTLEQCKQLGPDDDLVRQYDEWVFRALRRRTMKPWDPKLDAAPGAPEWAAVARQAWLIAREVPRWWMEHRMVPTGELGGQVGDDTDMYQNYADFPMFESDGVGAMVKDGAARLAELAEKQNLEAGLNLRTMDPLHAYEEGVNHEALMAWWNYGDPVCLERCMVAARSTEALTVVTAKGHRHFKNQDCGAADLRTDRKLGVDGHAHPLMWHPTLEVAWYNRNPRAMKHLREWADGWLDHMQPGKYATAVEVATEKVTETTDRPLYGGYGALGSCFLYLYGLTDDERYLSPFFEAFQKGSRNTSPHLILPELIQRHGLEFLGPKLAELVKGEGAAETLVTGDKKPLIEALKRDIAELQRFPAMYTTTEPFTDRVFLNAVSNAAIAYTGGYATRNKLPHTHAVSWEGLGTDYAALVLRAKRDHLKALVYNFADKPLAGRMRLWTLDHGTYALRVGPDADGDDAMDSAAHEEQLEVMRATGIPLALAPKAITVVELRQAKRLEPEWDRADLALSPRELRIEGESVHGIAHNLGSRQAESFEVALVDAEGKVRARKTLGPLAAPLDLVPRRLPFTLDGLPRGAKGWAVALDPDGRVPELFEGNNRAEAPAP
ncbi:MAG TPA: sugar-binding protein [Planctomycetota bacterium]|nr:sugar-binding protein [Planctomycetota bacterium]